MESVGPSRCPGGDDRSYPPVPLRHAGWGAHGRRGTLGLVRGYAGIETGCVLSPLLFNIFFAAAIEVVLVRFSEDHTILKDLVYLEEKAGVGAGTLLECARRAVWGMLYADDAGVVSRSQEGLTRMVTIIVEVFGAFRLTVSEKKTKTLLIRAPEKQPKKAGSPPPSQVIEAAGQKYAQTAQLRYLSGLVNEEGELTQENNHQSRAA